QELSDCGDDSAEGAALNQVTRSISRFGQLGSKCHATFSIVEAMVRSVKTAEARCRGGPPGTTRALAIKRSRRRAQPRSGRRADGCAEPAVARRSQREPRSAGTGQAE